MLSHNIAKQCRKYGVKYELKNVISTNIAGHKITVEKIVLCPALIDELIEKIENSDKKRADGKDNSMMLNNMVKKLKNTKETLI